MAAYRLLLTITSTGGAIGDPHMSTIDGEKYLLLQQGSFNFRQFCGLDAEVHLAGTVKKIPLAFGFPYFHTLLQPFVLHQKHLACGSIWPRPCKTQELGDHF